jgi:hypothetical protein
MFRRRCRWLAIRIPRKGKSTKRIKRDPRNEAIGVEIGSKNHSENERAARDTGLGRKAQKMRRRIVNSYVGYC